MCLKGGGGGEGGRKERGSGERTGSISCSASLLKDPLLGAFGCCRIRHENKRFWLSIVLGQYCISHGIASLIITSVVLMRLGERQKKKRNKKRPSWVVKGKLTSWNHAWFVQVPGPRYS